jgi:hypothetical protein
LIIIKLRCPSCYNETGFIITCLDGYENAKEITLAGKTHQLVHAHCLCKCPNCKQVVLAKIETTLANYQNIQEALKNFHYTPTLSFINLLEYWPKPPEPYSHESLPDDLKIIYKDLQEILWLKKSPSIVVGGCRSVLECALNELGAEGKSIRDKIDDLFNKGVITKVLANWAHHIRIEGNTAIHEIKTTPEEANEIVEFTKIFLIYTFELPHRIKLLYPSA